MRQLSIIAPGAPWEAQRGPVPPADQGDKLTVQQARSRLTAHPHTSALCPQSPGAPGSEQEAAAIISNRTDIHPFFFLLVLRGSVATQDVRPGCEKPSTQSIWDTHFPDPISPEAMKPFFLKLRIPLRTFYRGLRPCPFARFNFYSSIVDR